MESKLREMMEWECRRIAAVFGVENWQKREVPWAWHFRGGGCKNLRVSVDVRLGQWREINVRASHGAEDGEYDDDFCSKVWRVPLNEVTGDYDEAGAWHYNASSGSRYTTLCGDYDECLARGLYCLGVEDEAVLAELGYLLSTHEKLELRLSLPREFWPKKWLDEER